MSCFVLVRQGVLDDATKSATSLKRSKKGQYGLGVLLTHSFSSAWWFWLGHVKYRLGYESNGRKLFLTNSLPYPATIQKQHLVTTYKSLLKPLGIPLSQTAPRLFLSAHELADARALLTKLGVPENTTIVGINPGATYGSAKCWLPERSFARSLSDCFKIKSFTLSILETKRALP